MKTTVIASCLALATGAALAATTSDLNTASAGWGPIRAVVNVSAASLSAGNPMRISRTNVFTPPSIGDGHSGLSVLGRQMFLAGSFPATTQPLGSAQVLFSDTALIDAAVDAQASAFAKGSDTFAEAPDFFSDPIGGFDGPELAGAPLSATQPARNTGLGGGRTTGTSGTANPSLFGFGGFGPAFISSGDSGDGQILVGGEQTDGPDPVTMVPLPAPGLLLGLALLGAGMLRRARK